MDVAYPSIVRGLVSSSAHTRATCLSPMDLSSGSDEGQLALLATIATRDWSSKVRVAALKSFSAILQASSGKISPAVFDHIRSATRDPCVFARSASFAAISAASPTAETAFEIICSALALETSPRVRCAALETLAVLQGEIPGDKLVVALRRDSGHSGPIDMDVALAAGEYAGVISDGVEDCNQQVVAAAMRAVSSLSSRCSDMRMMEVEELMVSCASRALRNDSWEDAKREALLALSTEGTIELDSSCVRGVAREVRRGTPEASKLLMGALCTRAVKDFRVFADTLRSLEREMYYSRTKNDDGGCQWKTRVAFLSELIRAFALRNLKWVHVVDLSRSLSDKVAPYL